jgi:hypothetical protein
MPRLYFFISSYFLTLAIVFMHLVQTALFLPSIFLLCRFMYWRLIVLILE